MVYQKNYIVTESEKNRILSLHSIRPLKNDYIFESCVTIDGRYIIFMDEVFDIKNQKLVGNLWESIDTFKNIFSNIEVVGDEFQEIKESILSLPLLESNQNLKDLKNILLEFDFMQDTWLGRELSKSGKAITNTISQGVEGLKKFGVAISSGNWTEILSALAKGVRFVLRKLKSALYSNLGMIVDAILVATGIGKGAQMVAWALVLALDIYQFLNNDYPADEKNLTTTDKLLDIGFDILGLVTTGVFAKAGRNLFSPLRKGMKEADFFAKNPTALKYLQSIGNSLATVSGKLKSAASSISSKFPAGSKFISSTLGGLGTIIKNLGTTINNILTRVTGGVGKVGKGVRAGGVTGGITYGVDRMATKGATTQLSPIQIQNTDAFERVYKTYGNKDPFD